MLNIYYCLSTVSWKGRQGFHKGVVKSTFPFSIYQEPCNLGGLKYGQSARYSTSGYSFSFTLHANGALTPLPVKQCKACWRIRHARGHGYTFHDSTREGCMPGKWESNYWPAWLKKAPPHFIGSVAVWSCPPQSNLTLQVISYDLATFFLRVFGGYHFMTLPRPEQTVD